VAASSIRQVTAYCRRHDTQLSRFRDLFLIVRNSSFQYKGKAIDVHQVGCELIKLATGSGIPLCCAG
jgi:hypothetical protein